MFTADELTWRGPEGSEVRVSYEGTQTTSEGHDDALWYVRVRWNGMEFVTGIRATPGRTAFSVFDEAVALLGCFEEARTTPGGEVSPWYGILPGWLAGEPAFWSMFWSLAAEWQSATHRERGGLAREFGGIGLA